MITQLSFSIALLSVKHMTNCMKQNPVFIHVYIYLLQKLSSLITSQEKMFV